jgi:HSP20 family molecular chaperone IbpA
VASERINARYVNGVLMIKLANKASAKPKQIPMTSQKALGMGATAKAA